MVATPALLGASLGTLFIKELAKGYGDRCLNMWIQMEQLITKRCLLLQVCFLHIRLKKKQSKDNKL